MGLIEVLPRYLMEEMRKTEFHHMLQCSVLLPSGGCTVSDLSFCCQGKERQTEEQTLGQKNNTLYSLII